MYLYQSKYGQDDRVLIDDAWPATIEGVFFGGGGEYVYIVKDDDTGITRDVLPERVFPFRELT